MLYLQIIIAKTNTDNSSYKVILTYPYIDVLQGCPEHLQPHGDCWRKNLCTLYSLCPDKLADAQFAMTYLTEQLNIYNFLHLEW